MYSLIKGYWSLWVGVRGLAIVHWVLGFSLTLFQIPGDLTVLNKMTLRIRLGSRGGEICVLCRQQQGIVYMLILQGVPVQVLQGLYAVLHVHAKFPRLVILTLRRVFWLSNRFGRCKSR